MWYTIYIPEGIAAKSGLPLSIKTLIKILKQFESESVILPYIPTSIVQPAEHETLFEKY
jgi:hypothetical protein